MNTPTNLFKPDLREHFRSSLSDVYIRPDHRWLMYATIFILTGLGTFVAVWIYDISYDQMNQIPLSFTGMYAWHTAANFAFCFCLLDTLIIFVPRKWGAYQRRTMGKTWLVFLSAYLIGFTIQRTLIYHLVDLYSPIMILHHEKYPLERPGAIPMFLFMLPFWLAIGYTAFRLMLGLQTRAEELLRVRVDTILEERANQSKGCPQPAVETAATEDYIQLPTDPGVGPILPSQIGHVTVEDHYLRIYYSNDGKPQNTLIRMALKELSTRLPTDQFIQIHRSHIVNLQWISGVKRAGREVRLNMKHGAFDLPVSRYRLPHLLPVLDQFLNPG